MRVLMISKACVTALYRSKVVYLNQLAPSWQVGLVVPDRWGSLPFEPGDADESYPLYRLPIRLSGRNHLHWYPRLQAVVDAFQPDLLHIDEEHYSVITGMAATIARQRRIPSVFFTWQNIFKRYPLPFRLIEHQVFHSTVRAIAGNREAKGVLLRKGYAKPIHVIPQFGTDTRWFYPRRDEAFRAQLGLARTFAVGYVGRLVADKGLDDLWEAAVPLLTRYPAMRLVFVGSGPWQTRGEQLAREARMSSRIVWIPWAGSQDMPQIINALDVLVLPSRTTVRWKEQFGRVLTEAMAVRVPTVGSDSGEIPYVIGNAGLIVPEQNPRALGAQLERLYHDRALRRKLADRGLKRVHEHFSQEAIALKTLAVYEQTLGRLA